MDILKQIESYEGLKLKDVVFNKGVRRLTATFLYNPSLFVVADRVQEIEALLKSIVPNDVVVETKFNRSSLDKATIAMLILNTMTNNFPSMAKNFSLDDIKLTIDGMQILRSINRPNNKLKRPMNHFSLGFGYLASSAVPR